jgi:hypothetical protein
MLEFPHRQLSRKASARPLLVAPKEETIHRAIVSHLAHRAVPGTVWWHTPNGEARHAATGGKLRALGTRRGMPDLMFLKAGTLYALELKRDGGKVSDAQRSTLSELEAAGAVVAISYGLDDALWRLGEWGMLK